MADFTQAIIWLKKDKKVRRKIWEENSFICLSEENKKVLYQGEIPAYFHLNQFDADDWELFEEQKRSLSDKIQTIITEVNSVAPNPRRDMIEVKHIKEKIQNVQRRLKKAMQDVKYPFDVYKYLEEQDKIFKEEFGDKLI